MQAFVNKLISKYNLDLSDLTIFTEAASGPYLYNPLIAVISGAKQVFTYCKNSKFGEVRDIKVQIQDSYKKLGYSNSINFINEKKTEIIGKADIITNSGHVRPIDKNFICQMKSTAVIPLMWEPWEFRGTELDINTAKDCGILVMGTNEHEPPCDMRAYSSLTALKLLFDHGSSIVDENILIIGNQNTLAVPIQKTLTAMGLQCKRIETNIDISDINTGIKWATYIIVAEHLDNQLLIGTNALVSISKIVEARVHSIGVISGQVDKKGLEIAGVSVFPENLSPKGYMSYQPFELGPYPVMDLFAAGLKVGESMARARLKGLSTCDAAIEAMRNSPALDMEGDSAWISKRDF